MRLRPIDLAREAGISTQQVRRYEAAGIIPPAPRSGSGYRQYSQEHVDALLTARTILGGFGWQQGARALRHLHAGRSDRAFAIADRVHLTLHSARRQTLTTIETLRAVETVDSTPQRGRRTLSIGEAAAEVGVRVSALRHWEQQGLLEPERDKGNGRRRYGPAQLKRLRVIAMLRQSRYGIAPIRRVLGELAVGDVEAAAVAAEQRLRDINAASLRCAAATAALWRQYETMLA